MNKTTFTIDGKAVTAVKGITILEAALTNNIYIPHLCHHPELEPQGACRLCIVELDGKLVTSCRTAVKPGMIVSTRSPQVKEVLDPIVQMLIADHHSTCKGCTSSGKCQLQKVMAHLKIDRKQVQRLRIPADDPLDENPVFRYNPNKCILCGVCIATCEQAHGTSSLEFVGRGYETRVRFFGDKARCDSCRKCAERCPVRVIQFKDSAGTAV